MPNICLVFFCFFSLSGGVAPGQPATTMIMEGLDTLVPPSHHTFLALQDHFNAFCFDTVGSFMKTAATPTSFHLSNNNNNNNSSIPNNNNIIGATQQSHHSLHHLQAQQELRHPSAATTISSNNNNSNSNNNNNSNTSLNNSNINNNTVSNNASVKNCTSNNIASSSCNNSSSTTSIITASATIITSSGHPTLSLPSVTQQNSITKVSEANNNNNSGDLNTPVTTSSDIPSFFGPSTVVEPPPITSKYPFFTNIF